MGLKNKTKNISGWRLIVALLFLLIAVLAAGIAIGLEYAKKHSKQEISTAVTAAVAAAVRSIVPVRETASNYKFISPLLTYDFSDVKNFTEDQSLYNQLNSYIQSQTKQGNATDISAYVRDLTNGSWAGINEDQTYHPASMLKVVIMVAYYKEAEQDSAILQKSYIYTAAIDQQQATDIDFDQPTNMTVGKSYTVEQLVENMIINSDNGAETMLYDNIDQSSLNDVYTDLGLPNPANAIDYTISAKQYAVLLRTLYNSSYLSQDYSEKALGIMSQATFNKGIVAGLPNSTVAAQKFGEHVDGTTGNIQSVELHNCGVVYAKDDYVVCVMTKGQSINTLAGIIKNISQITYDAIAANGSDYK